MPYFNPRFFPEYDYSQRVWDFLRRDRNLIDVPDKALARTNLGVPIESSVDQATLGVDGTTWISPRRLKMILDSWGVRQERRTPPSLIFDAVSGATINTVQTSNTVILPAETAIWAVEVENGEWRKNGGAWTTSPGSVMALDEIQVRHTSSGTVNTQVETRLIVGEVDPDGGTDYQTTNPFRSFTGVATVSTPTWVAPNNAASGIGESPVLTASAFAVSAGSDTHFKSTWQIWTAAGGTGTKVWELETDADLISTVVAGGKLAVSTTYYARVRYTGLGYGDSAWSADVSFTTAASFALDKTLTVTRSVNTGRQFNFYGQTANSITAVSAADYPERFSNFLPQNVVVSPSGEYALVVGSPCKLLKKSGAGVWSAVGTDVAVSAYCNGNPTKARWSPDSTHVIVYAADRHASKNGIALIKRTGDAIALVGHHFDYATDPKDDMRVDAVAYSPDGLYLAIGYSGYINPTVPAYVPGYSTGGGYSSYTVPAQGYYQTIQSGYYDTVTNEESSQVWVPAQGYYQTSCDLYYVSAGSQYTYWGTSDTSVAGGYSGWYEDCYDRYVETSPGYWDTVVTQTSSQYWVDTSYDVWVETSAAYVEYVGDGGTFVDGYQPPYSLKQVAFHAYKIFKRDGDTYAQLGVLPTAQIANSITDRLRSNTGDTGAGITGFSEVFPQAAWSPDSRHLAIAVRGAEGSNKFGAAAVFNRLGDSDDFVFNRLVGNTIVGDTHNATYAGIIHYLGYSSNNRLFILQSKANNPAEVTLKVHQRDGNDYTNLNIPATNIQNTTHTIAIASSDGAHVYTCSGNSDRKVIRPYSIGASTATALTDLDLGTSFNQFSIHKAAT